MIAFLGRFHPLAVHVPIGVCLLAGLLEALTISHGLRRRLDPALPIILRLALVSALVAFALGLMLASEGGYPERLVRLHQRLTFAMVLASAVSVVTWSMQAGRRISRITHRLAIGATLTLLGAGAHVGGSMTHGEGYLVQHAPAIVKRWLGESARPADDAAPSPRSAGVAASEPRVFDDVVLPILKQRCAACHGVETAKGQLRLDDFARLMKGGRAGAAIAAGDAGRSLLMARIHEPLSDDGHMPPDGKPQLTSDEVELLALWIDRGASSTTKVRDLVIPDGARRLLVATGQASERDRAEGTPEPAATSAVRLPAADRPRDEATSNDPIAPILAAKCGRCHGPGRRKGTLRTDSPRARMTLLDRVGLPVDDDRHMPPGDAPQLDASELRFLSGWLARPGRTASASGPEPETTTSRPQPTATRFDAVEPILAQRCGACHSGAHPSGGLAVADPGMLIARSYVVPGHPEASPLLARLMLPLDDDDHMPPKTAPQPSRAEIDAVRSWIATGARAGNAVEASETPRPPGTSERADEDPAERSAATMRASRATVRGGCAGCTVTGSAVANRLAVGLGPVLLALLVLRRGRRR